MTKKLALTLEEISLLLNGGLEEEEPFGSRFVEVFNDIPMYHPEHVKEEHETHRNYMEKDGREYRIYMFKDVLTGIEHCIRYVYHPEIENSASIIPDSIEVVEESVFQKDGDLKDKLPLTRLEVFKLINGRLDDKGYFEEVFNDIPMYHSDYVIDKGETHRDYMEDDGREYRWYIFKDSITGLEHCINYTFNPDFENDIMDTPDTIQIVEESVLFKAPEPQPEPEPILSPQEQNDKDLMAKYRAVEHECKVFDHDENIEVPKKEIDDILRFMKTGKFNIFDLRAKIVPVCVEYKLNMDSFWKMLQVKRGAWNKN